MSISSQNNNRPQKIKVIDILPPDEVAVDLADNQDDVNQEKNSDSAQFVDEVPSDSESSVQINQYQDEEVLIEPKQDYFDERREGLDSEEFTSLGDFLTSSMDKDSGPCSFLPKISLPSNLVSLKGFFKIILLIFPFILLALFGIFALSSAEIKITPKQEDFDFVFNIKGDTGINAVDSEQNAVPLELFQVERTISQDIQSTGREVRESKAHGTITVYNTYSSSPQTLVETTRFVSDNGKLFRTKKTVTIPGATVEAGKIIPSSLAVEVEAAEAGEAYNIGPSTFSIPGFKGTPKYTVFYGKSNESMTGGLRGEVAVVSQNDIDEALNNLTSQVREEAQGELTRKIPQNLKLIDGSREVKITEVQKPEAGQEGERFKLSVRAFARALSFDENDLNNLIKENIRKNFSSQEKELVLDSLNVIYTLNKFPDFEEGILDTNLKVQGKVFCKLDKDIIKQALAGKSEAALKEYLNANQAIEKAQISLWPFWLKKIPEDSNKIKIKILIP